MLTDYQAGQLLYFHFMGDFKYKTDKGTRVARRQWAKMIDALVDGGYIAYNTRCKVVTAKGREYLDVNHTKIKTLN